MPELRKDPVIGRWVIIASERARRPGNFVERADNELDEEGGVCSLCNNQEKKIVTRPPYGNVGVIASRDSDSDSRIDFTRSKRGLYNVIDGVGVHEVVIETPEHVANMADLDNNQITDIIKTYAGRMLALRDDGRFRYALVYKNHGSTAGSQMVGHTRSHVVATSVRPLRVKEKLIGAKKYFDTHQSCIYCDLIRQELAEKKRVIYECEHFLAVIPFAARFLFETWILPKQHCCDFFEGVAGKEEELARILKNVLKKLQQGLDDPAYNYVIQTAPFRYASAKFKKWETISQDYHWHIELMPRLTHVAGFEKGTGFYICAIPPEDMAEYLNGIKIK